MRRCFCQSSFFNSLSMLSFNFSVNSFGKHITVTIMISRQNATGIQIGAVTHHQDQSITPHNFNTRNTTNKIVPRPIPLPSIFTFIYTFPRNQITHQLIIKIDNFLFRLMLCHCFIHSNE